jgi:ADP-ribosylglycohydrolase
VHWIYKKEALAAALDGIEETPEFRAESANPFYRIPTGRLSGYGDQTLVLLRHCHGLVSSSSSSTATASPPALDREAYAAAVTAHFGAGTEYDPTATSTYHVDGKTSGQTRRYEAEKQDKWPISGPWLHHSIKHFNEAVEAGKAWPQGSSDDKQADAAAKIVPVVCLHARAVQAAREAGDAAAAEATLATAVDEATRTTQNDDVTVSSAQLASRVILECLLGATPKAAITAAIAYMRDASRAVPLEKEDAECAEATEKVLTADLLAKTHQEAVDELGNTCMLMNSLQTPLHAAAVAGDAIGEAEFLAATRSTLVASGCNCSRLCILGAILGAVGGFEAVPEEWVAKTSVGEEVVASASAIAAFVTSA